MPFFSANKIRIKWREGSLKKKIYALQGRITDISVMTKWSLLFTIKDEKIFHNAVTILIFSYSFEVFGYSSGYSYQFYAFWLQFWFMVTDKQFWFWKIAEFSFFSYHILELPRGGEVPQKIINQLFILEILSRTTTQFFVPTIKCNKLQIW